MDGSDGFGDSHKKQKQQKTNKHHLKSKSYVLHHRPKIKQKETYSIQNILPKYRPNEKFSINTSYIKNT